MTDQEINEAVAKKLGWVKHENLSPIHWIRDGEGFCGCQTPWSCDSLYHLPDYCNKIKDAWKVVAYCLMDRDRARVFDWQLREGADCDHDSFGIENINPMAICKAFLKLP